MHSGALAPACMTGWLLIILIQLMLNTLVHPPWMSFTVKAGDIWVLSDNLNAAAPSIWKFGLDALTISSVYGMYPTTVFCMLWVWDSFSVACWFWLPCHTSKHCGPWQLWAIFFPQLLSSFPSCFQYSSHPMLGNRWPMSNYWRKQTALWRVFRKVSSLWYLSVCSQ